MGVYITQKGDFNNVEKWLNSLLNRDYLNIISEYGQKGVDALRKATPIDSGLAASSWGYEIQQGLWTTTIVWTNSDIEGGCSVVLLLDRGHATKSGSWVSGLHFIDDAIDPVIDDLVQAVCKGVTK